MRVAFLNLQSGVGTVRGYWQYLTGCWKYLLPHAPSLLEPLGSFVQAQGVELLACVESELPSRRGQGIDYTEALAFSSGLLHRIAYPTHCFGRLVRQANSLHSRYPILASANHPLPGGGEPRYLGEARLDIEGAEWTALVTHLSLSRPSRAGQLAAIAQLVGPGRQRTILMGDFNTADVAEFAPLFEIGLLHATTGPTYPSWRPSVSLDHLFTSPDLASVNAQVADTVRLSDHLPLIGEIAIAREEEVDAGAAGAEKELAGL